ncbi:MAG: succinylglutamate desuccinylase/aspartoacylase family protein [Planctomycetota bacterium]|nr:succinylglutamate desuccinylase/aspartoacylase family protein [Planctomycetota bacterium]
MPVTLASQTLTGDKPGPHVLITGGVHGDEWEPMGAIRRLRFKLAGRLRRGRVTLIPIVNEAAFARGSRVADDGLDLARTCPGRVDGSVTEQTAWALSEVIRSADFYVDLHTGGTRLKVLPLAGYMLHPDKDVLEKSRRMARLIGLPLVWGTDWRLNGRSLSVARDANVPAIYCEYQGGGMLDSAGVEAYVAGCVNLLADLGLTDGPVTLPPADQRVVEDDRPSAGHMQINHPTQNAGFFEAAVGLGDRVTAGGLLGTVYDPFGDTPAEIRAQYAGQVIVLHTYARIEANTSVAVILEDR